MGRSTSILRCSCIVCLIYSRGLTIVTLTSSDASSSDAYAGFTLFEVESFATGKVDMTKGHMAKWQRKPLWDIRAHSYRDNMAVPALRGMLAIGSMAEDAKAIELATSLGNCEIKIKAIAKQDKLDEIAKRALQYVVWHVVPSKAYAKDEKFRRNSDFSDSLCNHLQGFIEKHVGELFSGIEIGFAKYEAPDSAEAILKNLEKLSPEQLARIAKAVEAKSKPATPKLIAA